MVALESIPDKYAHLLSPLRLAEQNSSNWISTRWHKVLDREVRDYLHSDDEILVVTAPPRHGKSEYLAHWLPVWYEGLYPDRSIMLCSYAAGLAKFHSKWVRDTYHKLAPLFDRKGVRTGSSKADDWQTYEGGGVLSSGVQGGVTGRGAHLILIDDYLRSAKDAESKAYRDTIWEWFRATISTRREPGAKIIILATPWNRKDLIGELLQNADLLDLKLRRVQLKALYDGEGEDPLGREPGEALWPERFPADWLEKQRKLMTNYWFLAQYQGEPTLRGDTEWPDWCFKNIWVDEDDWPKKTMISAAVLDPSKGRTDKSDYQALAYVGYHDGYFWVDSDIDRRSVTSMTKNMARRCKEWRPTVTGIEANAFQDLLAPDYEAACADVGYAGGNPELIDNTVAKEVRIRRLGQFLENHKFRFLRNRSNELLVEQLQAFPGADHDDGPDALEGAMRLLCQLANLNYGDPEQIIYEA